MNNKSSQLPKDIYHRLYWYAKRNVDPARIAAALNLSIKTVHQIIGKLAEENNRKSAAESLPPLHPASTKALPADFLDLFVFTKTRYSVVDISGSIDKMHIQKFRETLLKITSTDRKPLALKMTDVTTIDDTGVGSIKTLYTDIARQGRYCAILDPSLAVESALKRHGLDALIPIFGTELAFEERAFRLVS